MSAPPRAAPRPARRPSRELVLAGLLAVEIAAFGLVVPGYLSPAGLLDATRFLVEVGLVALGMTLVIVSGGIDLSVGALLALVSVAVGFSYQAGLPFELALLFGVAVGGLGGALNGAVVAGLGLHPFAVTLGTAALFRGLAYAVSNAGAVSSFPDWFGLFGQRYLLGLVPVQLVYFAALCALVAVLLSRSAYGRAVYGVGLNRVATRFSGVRTERVTFGVYALTGLLVALAALIYTSRVSTARGNAGLGLELSAIAAVVLGGASIAGGSGSVLGTILGVLILAYLQDGLVLAGVRSDWGLIVVGVVLALGVFVNEALRREEG